MHVAHGCSLGQAVAVALLLQCALASSLPVSTLLVSAMAVDSRHMAKLLTGADGPHWPWQPLVSLSLPGLLSSFSFQLACTWVCWRVCQTVAPAVAAVRWWGPHVLIKVLGCKGLAGLGPDACVSPCWVLL